MAVLLLQLHGILYSSWLHHQQYATMKCAHISSCYINCCWI